MTCHHSPRHLRSGFTLVEVLVVISIIGILAAIAIPAISNAVANAKTAAMRMEVDAIEQAIEKYQQKYGDYPPDFTDWPTVQRHYKKIFPRILQSELDRLRLLTDIDTSNDEDTTLPTTWPDHDPNRLDRAEALVWALGGFSSNPQLPFTGPGGPLEAVTSPAMTAYFQVNTDRENSFFDFDTARLNLTEVDASAAIDSTNRYLSQDDGSVPGNDVFPAYAATDNGAPYVYFDSRTYRINTGTDAAPFMNGYGSATYGFVRPFASDIAVANTSGSDYPTRVAALGAWQFMKKDTFQVVGPGIDETFGAVLSFDVDGDMTNDPIFFQYPSGRAIAAIIGMGIATPGDLIVPDSRAFQEASIFGGLDNFQLDNVTNFSKSKIVDDVVDP